MIFMREFSNWIRCALISQINKLLLSHFVPLFYWTQVNKVILFPAYIYFFQPTSILSSLNLFCPVYIYFVQPTSTLSSLHLLCPAYIYFVQPTSTFSGLHLLFPAYIYFFRPTSTFFPCCSNHLGQFLNWT